MNDQTSIVKQLKLPGLDISIKARHKLADELDFSNDKKSSVNVWLIKQADTGLAKMTARFPAGWNH